ncbi:MAG: MarR family winged helix-turn-helix transcriptional regulator [Actinomycetes bacterium]
MPTDHTCVADGTPGDVAITTFGLLMEVRDGLVARLSPQLTEHHLSVIEAEVLVRLLRSPGHRLRMADLAAQVGLTASGLTRVVDRLEQGGLVVRAACPSDRRGTFAQLTAAGRERIGQALPGHLDLIERWFIGLASPEELATLTAVLRRIRDEVRPDALAGVVE